MNNSINNSANNSANNPNDPAGLTAELTAELQADNKALREQVKLLVHQLITCGVAADHSDPELSRRKSDYGGKWDSPQAQRVRKLRDSRDFYLRRCTALQEIQKLMRDPERKMVCDVIANGKTYEKGVDSEPKSELISEPSKDISNPEPGGLRP